MNRAFPYESRSSTTVSYLAKCVCRDTIDFNIHHENHKRADILGCGIVLTLLIQESLAQPRRGATCRPLGKHVGTLIITVSKSLPLACSLSRLRGDPSHALFGPVSCFQGISLPSDIRGSQCMASHQSYQQNHSQERVVGETKPV